MGKLFLRVLAGLLFLEGALFLLLGRRYPRLWAKWPGLRRQDGSPAARLLHTLAAWPNWLLRLLGALETVLGLCLLRHAPLSPSAFYGSWAPLYRRIGILWRYIGYRKAFSTLAQELRARVHPEAHLLDLGCGTGENLDHLLSLKIPFATYLGVDVSERMLAQARSRFTGLPGVEFRRMDLLCDPWPEGPFDLILATWLMEHLPDTAAVAGQALSHLRPGGCMIALSEYHDGSWRARLVDQAWHLIGARLPREEEYRTWPGLQVLHRQGGFFAPTTIVVLCNKRA
ncbi:MAG: class I SAM-dependent methyltransferase [Chloroflexi bacterium]|nr:class I SAM-dependent methyltransferase [Chloroflexota bacterium]